MNGLRGRCLSALVGSAVLLGLLWAGYQLAFSTFAFYDDEGYLLVSLKAYRAGGALYDEVYSQYGPAYFMLQSYWHDACQLPVTHDVARLRLLAVWALIATLGAWCVARMTGSAAWAVVALVAFFFHLDRMALEPSHPQEWCAVLLAAGWCVVVLGTPSPSAVFRLRPWQVATLLGVVTGTLAMVKPNLGLFLALGTAAALLDELPTGRWQRAARVSCLALVVAAPWCLMRAQIGDLHEWTLPVLVSAAMLLVAVSREPRTVAPNWAWRDVGLYVTACTGMVWVFAMACLADGTSASGLWRGLIGQHVGFGSQAFYHTAPLPSWTLAALGVSVLLCGLARRRPGLARRLPQLGLLGLPVVLLCRQMADSTLPLVHGTTDRGWCAAVIALAGSFGWLLLCPRVREACQLPRMAVSDRFSRHWLACAAVTQLLGAHPVPGTQMAVGSLLLVGVALVIASDGVRAWQGWPRLEQRLPARWLVMGLVYLAIATVAVRDAVTWQRRTDYVPLALPGATRLRLPADVVDEAHWLVKQLRAHGDTFVFREHTRNSYYLWAQLPPPTSLNATCWPYLLDKDQQQRVLAVLGQFHRVAVVTEPYPAPLPRAQSPLLRYLDRRFEPAAAGRHYRVGTLRATDG